MALKLENEFVVAAPVERTWTMLLDLERVARCLPGATVEPGSEEGTYNGSVRVKVGPMTLDYSGVARIASVDEVARIAAFDVQGKEVRGQGSASATISNKLMPEGESTRVLVETSLSVTGRPAQFGRGIMQDVAASMLTGFANCLSQQIAAEPEAGVNGSVPRPSLVDATPRESLQLTGVVGRVLRRRLAHVTGLSALRRLLSRLAARR